MRDKKYSDKGAHPTHQKQWYFPSPFQLDYKKSYFLSQLLCYAIAKEIRNSSHFDYQQAVNAEQQAIKTCCHCSPRIRKPNRIGMQIPVMKCHESQTQWLEQSQNSKYKVSIYKISDAQLKTMFWVSKSRTRMDSWAKEEDEEMGNWFVCFIGPNHGTYHSSLSLTLVLEAFKDNRFGPFPRSPFPSHCLGPFGLLLCRWFPS